MGFAWVVFVTALSSVILREIGRTLHRFSATQCFSRVIPSRPLHGLDAIPEMDVDTFDRDAFETSFRSRGIPVVVRNYATTFSAFTKWKNISYFGQRCPDFFIHDWQISLAEYTNRLATLERARSPEDFASMKELGKYYFSHNERLFYECPQLFDDVDGFPVVRAHASKPGTVFANVARRFINLFSSPDSLPSDVIDGDWIQAVTWIGPPGSRTLLHYDDDPLSFLIQFRGHKKVRIWSPDQSKLLYPQDSCSNLEEYVR